MNFQQHNDIYFCFYIPQIKSANKCNSQYYACHNMKIWFSTALQQFSCSDTAFGRNLFNAASAIQQYNKKYFLKVSRWIFVYEKSRVHATAIENKITKIKYWYIKNKFRASAYDYYHSLITCTTAVTQEMFSTRTRQYSR
jgi:hypothetical protein